MDLTRRNFLQGLGIFSFSVALGIPSPSHNTLPDYTLCGVDMKKGNWGEESIKAAYLGIGLAGLDAGRKLSQHLAVDLQKFPGSDQGQMLLHLCGSPTIRDVESYLQGKDIITVVGSLCDQGLNYARELALEQAKFIWTIVLSHSDSDDTDSIKAKPNETIRLLRHSLYPLDHPEIFTRMARDIWIYHNVPPRWMDISDALCDLGI